jgi:acyl carrier protein
MSNGRSIEERVRTCVRAAWQDALTVTVGDDAHFFDLGGDSLAALSICARFEDSFQVRPKLRVLFDHPLFDEYVRELLNLLRSNL